MQSIPVQSLKEFYPEAPGLNNNVISLGSGIYRTFGRMTAGVKGATLFGRERITNGYEFDLSGLYGQLEVGYQLHKGKKWVLTPFLSAGYGTAIYRISDIYSYDLSTVTTPQINSASFHWNSPVFDAGIRVEHFLSANGLEGDGPFFSMIGIEAGYFFSQTHNDWKTRADAFIFNAPDYNVRGIYLKIFAGGFSLL
jgi:hypothetical protein